MKRGKKDEREEGEKGRGGKEREAEVGRRGKGKEKTRREDQLHSSTYISTAPTKAIQNHPTLPFPLHRMHTRTHQRLHTTHAHSLTPPSAWAGRTVCMSGYVREYPRMCSCDAGKLPDT
jgi:hypothetical protein